MQRTNTTRQLIFKPATGDDATFDFSAPNDIKITVPKGSNWRTEYHWHNNKSCCTSIKCLQGHLDVFYSRGSSHGSTGLKYTFSQDGLYNWSSSDREEDLVVVLTADETLYRNKCSAILDAYRFPFLVSTPIWLRVLFRVASLWQPMHQWLLRRMLWVQMQAMNYASGYFTFHGLIPVVSMWRAFHPFDKRPPQWVSRLQRKSLRFFSNVFEGGCFWLGKVVGIQGQYPEYTSPYHRGLEKGHTEH